MPTFIEGAAIAAPFVFHVDRHLTVEGGGGYYASTRHVRGPNGPRGGYRTQCGVRWRYEWEASQIPADVIAATATFVPAARGEPYRRPPRFENRGYNRWYRAWHYVCPECAKTWVKNELRAAR